MKLERIAVVNAAVSESDIIFVLDFLGSDDLQTGKRCFEDIQDITQTNERIKRFSCNSRGCFSKIQEKIKRYSKSGYSPLIHIHGHGHKNNGIQLLKSNDYISWQEFINFFKEIKPKNGNLTVIMSCCYSNSIVKLVKQAQELSLPFAFFYGYGNKIQAGVVQNETKVINESFLNDGGKSLMECMKDLHITHFSEFDYMNQFLGLIFDEYEIGKNREKLVLSMPKEEASFTRKCFNELYRDNPMKLIRLLAQTIIQNSERRKNYVTYIEKQISSIKQEETPPCPNVPT